MNHLSYLSHFIQGPLRPLQGLDMTRSRCALGAVVWAQMDSRHCFSRSTWRRVEDPMEMEMLTLKRYLLRSFFTCLGPRDFIVDVFSMCTESSERSSPAKCVVWFNNWGKTSKSNKSLNRPAKISSVLLWPLGFPFQAKIQGIRILLPDLGSRWVLLSLFLPGFWGKFHEVLESWAPSICFGFHTRNDEGHHLGTETFLSFPHLQNVDSVNSKKTIAIPWLHETPRVWCRLRPF